MERNKVDRLNCLFEKVVSESASIFEQKELKYLYKEFFDEGRENTVTLVAGKKTKQALAS